MSQGSGNIGSKSIEFVVGLDSIFTLMPSLTHSVGQLLVAYAYEAVSYKNCMLALVRACSLKLSLVGQG